MSSIGDRVYKARSSKRWSRYKLAQHAGQNQTWVRDLELGLTKEPGHDKLLSIAEALGVSIDSLLYENPPPKEDYHPSEFIADLEQLQYVLTQRQREMILVIAHSLDRSNRYGKTAGGIGELEVSAIIDPE